MQNYIIEIDSSEVYLLTKVWEKITSEGPMVQPQVLIMTQIPRRSNKSNISSKCLGRDFSLCPPRQGFNETQEGEGEGGGEGKKESSEKITHKEKEENQE